MCIVNSAFILFHLECTKAVMCIVNSAFAVPILLYQQPCSDTCCWLASEVGHSTPIWKQEGDEVSQQSQLLQLVLLPRHESTWRIACLLCLWTDGVSKMGSDRTGKKTDFRLPAQASVATNSEKSHGHIHCGQTPMPAFIRKVFFSKGILAPSWSCLSTRGHSYRIY